MWLITPIGFFSVVQKPDDKHAGTLTVRARLRSDLAALKLHYLPGLGAINESSDTDYRFRATAPRADVSAAMSRLVEALDYSNFKAEVAKRQGHARSGLYHDVWSVLYKLQTDPAFEEKELLADSYGGVVVSGGNKVLLREPSNHHGGYAWTFAKTEAKPGESPRDAAIRAVLEKTGYESTIRISVPGLFKGSASATNYYVMDAKHPPARAGWQTASLRWVTFDEARELIRQSPNAEGRDRDLAILDAAEKSAAAIPYGEHARVQPEDWNELREMALRSTVLYPRLNFTAEQMERIKRGFFPTVMEQKWFLYFTGDRLRMHRSWTGFLIYDVGFTFDSTGGASVTDVIVNRDPDQYGNTDDEEDLKLVQEIIRGHLLDPLEEPAVDGFAQGVMLASKPNYLGSPEVVSSLLGEVFDVAVQAIKDEATPEDLQTVAAKVIAAFTDDAAGYTRMPGWHSAEQLGTYVKKYLVGAQDISSGETLATIFDAGLGAVLAKLDEMLIAFLGDPRATWHDHALIQLNELHQYVVAVLLGTNTLNYGERTLSDFRWAQVATPGGGEKCRIVGLASEAGELALVGIQTDAEWKFRVETDESALSDLLEEDDQIEVPERPWVDTWRSALKQLDFYPWPQLHPLDVHEDFRDRVLKALQTRQKKGLSVDWGQWGKLLGKENGE
jgi:ADP-ribose pyrophosphatase YjhB (NUDIX family)